MRFHARCLLRYRRVLRRFPRDTLIDYKSALRDRWSHHSALDVLADVCSNFVLSNAKCVYNNIDIDWRNDKKVEVNPNLYKQSQENVVKNPLIL
jgi:hypothetical protein